MTPTLLFYHVHTQSY